MDERLGCELQDFGPIAPRSRWGAWPALTELTTSAFSPAVVGSGVLFALIIGIWIRLADL